MENGASTTLSFLLHCNDYCYQVGPQESVCDHMLLQTPGCPVPTITWIIVSNHLLMFSRAKLHYSELHIFLYVILSFAASNRNWSYTTYTYMHEHRKCSEYGVQIIWKLPTKLCRNVHDNYTVDLPREVAQKRCTNCYVWWVAGK